MIKGSLQSRIPTPRHAELVSASIVRTPQPAQLAKWTLKQVQGDGVNGYVWEERG
jgi:hypothetical protein